MPHPTHPSPTALTALLAPKPGKGGELYQTVMSLLGGIQAQPGSLACSAAQDLGAEPPIRLSLLWKDRSALEAFMATEVFQILLGALQVLAASTEFRIAAATEGPAGEAAGPGFPCTLAEGFELISGPP